MFITVLSKGLLQPMAFPSGEKSRYLTSVGCLRHSALGVCAYGVSCRARTTKCPWRRSAMRPDSLARSCLGPPLIWLLTRSLSNNKELKRLYDFGFRRASGIGRDARRRVYSFVIQPLMAWRPRSRHKQDVLPHFRLAAISSRPLSRERSRLGR